MKVHFIGLDLAWSPRNKSGGAAIEAAGDHARWLDASERLGDDQDTRSTATLQEATFWCP